MQRYFLMLSITPFLLISMLPIVAEQAVYGPRLEGFAYPYPVKYFTVNSQPVIYEFPLLSMPVILLIGEQDNTTIGKDTAPEALRLTLGNYAKLGPAAATAIPNAKLIRFADLGHSPHIQAPERFHQALSAERANTKG